MYLIHVIPISRGVQKDYLSYFSSKKISSGTIVSIPLRKKTVNALAVGSSPVREEKTGIRSSAYRLKKIQSVKQKKVFLPGFLKAVSESAYYFVSPLPSALHALTPSAFDMDAKNSVSATTEEKASESFRVSLLQADDDDRISTYKSIVREQFARGSSVFLCLPEISEIEYLTEKFKKGIEDYTFVFHSGIPKKELVARRKKVLEETHPVLIIGTPSFLSIPKTGIDTLIVEKESSRAYKMQTRPYIDFRYFAESFGKHGKKHVIFGDIFLRPETIYRHRKLEVDELAPLQFRSLDIADQKIIDMREEKITSLKKTIVTISADVKNLLTSLGEKNEKMFFLVSKTGLFPTTICSDCGATVTCERCSAPLVLHERTKNKRVSMCHKCKAEEKPIDRCKQCDSWRLTTLGIGIEQIEKEIKNEFPDISIFVLSKDTAGTHKKAIAIRDKFYNTPGSILLGTEMAAPYIKEPVENIVVGTLDSLFTIPDFRMNARIFTLLIRLRRLASKHFYIQTRDLGNTLFKNVVSGNLIDFYRQEIALRKELKYPPFTTLIKITLSGHKDTVTKKVGELLKELERYEAVSFPAFTKIVKARYHAHVLVKLPRGKWVDKELHDILTALPREYSVHIDPESIL